MSLFQQQNFNAGINFVCKVSVATGRKHMLADFDVEH